MYEEMRAALKFAIPRLTDDELDALTEAAADVARSYASEAAIDAIRDYEERQ